jgi:hypothetical protein
MRICVYVRVWRWEGEPESGDKKGGHGWSGPLLFLLFIYYITNWTYPTPHHKKPKKLKKQDYLTLLDIKDEVYSWWDHGLVSAALHPEFPQQPYLYIAVRLAAGCMLLLDDG